MRVGVISVFLAGWHFDHHVQAFTSTPMTTKNGGPTSSSTIRRLMMPHHHDESLSSSSSSTSSTTGTVYTVHPNRRQVLASAMTSSASGILLWSMNPISSSAATPTKALSEEYRQGTAALADMDDMAPVPREAYKKLPSGVVIADLRPGTSSEVVRDGSKVNLQWVLRKSNGYFVDSSKVANDGAPFIFTVGDGTAIAGVDEGVRGMKQGSVRRILIPPSLAYVNGLEDGKPGPLPVGFGPRQQMRRVQNVRKDVPGEYIFLEVQVTRVR